MITSCFVGVALFAVLAQSAAQAPAPPQPLAAAKSTPDQTWPPAGVHRDKAPGVTSPVVIKESKPRYSAEAMERDIRGTVELQAVVRPDGSVGEVRVIRSLDPTHGLDASATTALEDWRFKPGMKDGRAVPVLVTVEMTFSKR